MAERPKLAIAHLALWASAVSIYVAVIRKSGVFELGVTGAIRYVSIVTFAGAAISGAVIVATRLIRGKRWPTAPGEWLVFVLGVILAVDAVSARWPDGAIVRREVIFRCVSCLITLLPTLSRQLSWTWKSYFMLMVFLQFAGIAISIGNIDALRSIFLIRCSCGLTIPLILAMWDRYGDSGWLHWLGLGLNSVWFGYLLYSLT